jgi:membrane protein DedA with SNARE-associated domain
MQAWIIDIMNKFGYIGIAFLIALENIFPPIPSEVILTFGGFMTTRTGMNFWLTTLASTIGSVLGAVVLYGIGCLMKPQRLESIINKYGRFLRVDMQQIEKAESIFVKHGSITVFLCRFVPIVRSLISIPAGMSGMNFAKFLFYTTIGTAIWNAVLIRFGSYAGENWMVIIGYMDAYQNVIIALFVVVFVALAVWFFVLKKDSLYRKRKNTGKDNIGKD